MTLERLTLLRDIFKERKNPGLEEGDYDYLYMLITTDLDNLNNKKYSKFKERYFTNETR